MKRSTVRMGFLIVVSPVILYLAALEVKKKLWPDPSFEGQARKLESRWASERREAAASLAQFQDKADKVVPALITALSDQDTEVRSRALASLEAFGQKPKAAGPRLKELLENDPDGKIRQRAALMLGQIAHLDAVPDLVAALDAPDPGLRTEATRALGQFGRSIATTELIDKLMAGLKPDQPAELREASVIALESLAPDDKRVTRALGEVLTGDPSPAVRGKGLARMSKPATGIEVPALVAALEDPSPQVRLAAGTALARIGLNDDRTVPALCKAAHKPDESTREGIGMNFEHLMLQSSPGSAPDDILTRRYQTAAQQMGALLEDREAAGREQVLTVLGRLIATYQKSGKTMLLEPARTALAAVVARIEDEKEDTSLRVQAMNQWGMVQPLNGRPARGAPESPAEPAGSKDELHARTSWIAVMGRALKSSVGDVRYRAIEILTESIAHTHADPSLIDAWRKVIPALAEVTGSADPRLCNGALSLLGQLGPERK